MTTAGLSDTRLHCKGPCGRWLPDDRFHAHPSFKTRRGRRPLCKECHIKKFKANLAAYWDGLWEEFISGGCQDCGLRHTEEAPLDGHHEPPWQPGDGTRALRHARVQSKARQRRAFEACVPLCWPCHLKRHGKKPQNPEKIAAYEAARRAA